MSVSTMTVEKKVSREARLRPSLRQPLQRLHAGIRRYVTIEALSVLAIAVTGWCAASLVFDWGVLFGLFGFDYLHDGPGSVAALVRNGMFLVLVGIVAWVLYRYLIVRWLKPLPDADLALVLERRFGPKLADRLVTAVELADAREAQQQGYSWSMIEETTRAAEEQLQGLRVDEALDRGRLRKRLLIAVGCVLVIAGLLVLAPEVAATWGERNLLFRNVPWPRSIVLEMADFAERNKAVPFGSELKVLVRSAKWAVADSQAREGWRAARWEDVLPGVQSSAWELQGMEGVEELRSALPEAWQKLPLDQVEVRLQETSVGRDLGLALIRKIQEHYWEHRQGGVQQRPAWVKYLPEKMQQMGIEQQKVALAAAAGLSVKDAERIGAGLTSLRPALGDAVMMLSTLSSHPVVNPLPCLSALQKVAYDRDRNVEPFAMPENERLLLPGEWQKLPIRDLVKRLKTFAQEESAEALGERVAERVRDFFQKLQERAELKKMATRKSFRELIVPEKITLEFENIASSEERLRGRAKRGQPELKRAALSNEFIYEFKKVERPMRLRAYAASVSTPWHEVEVKPLPTLKHLVRFHRELGYLHGSNSEVPVGPLALPLDGEESRGDAPRSSTVWLEGESHKPLQSVRVVTENPADMPIVEHQSGAMRFVLRLPALKGEDLRMRLEYEDMDGIVAVRKILLMLIPDKAPEFIKAQFEAVNRKFVTPQAILPLSVTARDDVALLDLQYEISLQKNDRTVMHELKLPMRQFSPLRVHGDVPGGLRFEQPEEVTLPGVLSRLPSEQQGDPLQMISAAGRLPAGWLAIWPAWRASLRKEYTQDYVDRNLYGPVVSVEDEFLDTRLLRSALNKPMEQPLLTVPYRMVIRLSARDNRMVRGNESALAQHQEGKTSEAFEFNVVSEQDVLIEAGRREEDLRDRFEEAIAGLMKIRSTLKRIREDLEVPSQAKDDEIRRAVNDAQDATKALAAVRTSLDEKVLREFRQVYRELALNRVDARVLDRVDGRICRPLAVLLQPGQGYGKLEELVDTLARRLDAERLSTPKNVLTEPLDQCNRVLAKMDEILQDMKKLIEFNEALRVLRDLINNEQKLLDLIKTKLDDKIKSNLDDDDPKTKKKEEKK